MKAAVNGKTYDPKKARLIKSHSVGLYCARDGQQFIHTEKVASNGHRSEEIIFIKSD